MTHVENVAVTAQVTFGRDGAMFEGLLGFVAQLSVVLWCLVILTLVIRFVGIRIYRHAAARKVVVETVETVETVAPRAVPAAAVFVPAEFAAVRATDSATRSHTHVHAFAGKSREA